MSAVANEAAVEWLSAEEASTILEVTIPSVHKWRKRGVFKVLLEERSPLGAVAYRFDKAEVQAIKESMTAVVRN